MPQSDVPGERTSPTQPFPTKPAAFDRQGITGTISSTSRPSSRPRRSRSPRSTSGAALPAADVRGTDGKIATMLLPHHTGGANWPGGAAIPRRE